MCGGVDPRPFLRASAGWAIAAIAALYILWRW